MNRENKRRLKEASKYCFKSGIYGQALRDYLRAACGVSDIAVDAWLKSGNSHPRPSNIHKRCRAVAMQEARRRNLWKQGEDAVYQKWYRRIFVRFFPSLRKKYNSWIGRWYRKCVKFMAKQARASVHDPVIQQYLRLRRKNEKKARVNASIGSGPAFDPS
jgi:hypothetical protein